MKKVLFFGLMLLLGKSAQSQDANFCIKLDTLFSSMKNNQRNLWGEFIEGDSFTQTYRAKFSLLKENKSKTTFAIIGGDKTETMYSETIYSGNDSIYGLSVYKKFKKVLETCTNFSIKESKNNSYKDVDAIFYFDRFTVTLRYTGHGFSVRFLVMPLRKESN